MREFTDEEWAIADARKDKILEKWFGPCAPICQHAVINYEMGGPLDAHFYPRSRYGGTLVVSKDLVDPKFSSPKNKTFNAFELAMATRRPLPPAYFKNGTDVEKESDPEFEKFVERAIAAMTTIGRYVQYQCPINRFETLEFPQDYDEPELAGRCFVFDAVGTPKKSGFSLGRALKGLFGNPETPPAPQGGSVDVDDVGFGILIMIEVFRDEMNRAREEGVEGFLQRMKQAGRWPFSDLDRPQI
ncbi:MAG: suppressor of fused domain protein [Thermoguttaceae bacterium]|nr:suppressor of fused domain protein [Thermoguttaceae bacterium]